MACKTDGVSAPFCLLFRFNGIITSYYFSFTVFLTFMLTN